MKFLKKRSLETVVMACGLLIVIFLGTILLYLDDSQPEKPYETKPDITYDTKTVYKENELKVSEISSVDTVKITNLLKITIEHTPAGYIEYDDELVMQTEPSWEVTIKANQYEFYGSADNLSKAWSEALRKTLKYQNCYEE